MGNDYTQTLKRQKPTGLTDIRDIIYELESSSGTDKTAYTANDVGALGGYQLRPDAFKDVKRVFKSKWKGKDFKKVAMDDEQAREAAADYVKIIGMEFKRNNLAPTMDALLIGYHSGMGNVLNGNIGDDGLDYIKRSRELRE